MELFQQNIVVTASNFNVLLVNQIWLDEHGVIPRGEMAPGASVFTPPLVQVSTPNFEFLLVEDRLQFTPLCEDALKQDLIVDRLGRFINLLPHTPYTGLGLNFIWHSRSPGPIEEVSRRLFFWRDSSLARFFDVADAKFGAYYSKNTMGFRLKVSAMPVTLKTPGRQSEDILQLGFNYHLDSRQAETIRDALGRWNQAKHDSEMITDAVEATI
jgi:hypothetical protein